MVLGPKKEQLTGFPLSVECKIMCHVIWIETLCNLFNGAVKSFLPSSYTRCFASNDKRRGSHAYCFFLFCSINISDLVCMTLLTFETTCRYGVILLQCSIENAATLHKCIRCCKTAQVSVRLRFAPLSKLYERCHNSG